MLKRVTLLFYAAFVTIRTHTHTHKMEPLNQTSVALLQSRPDMQFAPYNKLICKWIILR